MQGPTPPLKGHCATTPKRTPPQPTPLGRKQNREQRKRIQAKLHRKTSKKMWYFINRSQKNPRCGAFHFVQRVVDDVVQESTTQTSTEDYIFEKIEMRFELAAQAPISGTTMIDQLDYLGDFEIAR